MATNTKKDKTWLWVMLVVIAVLLVLYLVNSIRTVTYYIADQKPSDYAEILDTLTDEEKQYYENRLMFEVNYYENSDKSGLPLQELKMDFFTDKSLSVQASRSVGMQFTGTNRKALDYRYMIEEKDHFVTNKNLYYYDTTVMDGNVISWSGDNVGTPLTRSAKFIVKINDKPYLMQLTGYDNKLEVAGIELFNEYYSYGTLFVDCLKAVQTNSKGYGEYYITINLSKYFTLNAYDELTDSFTKTNVAKEVLTYSTLKFHYYKNGATKMSQSLFGIIGNFKPTYTITFDANGGSGSMENQVIKNGVAKSLTSNAYTKLGYTFAGWNTKADGTGEYYPDEYNVVPMIDEDTSVTLYAQWEVAKYTITFNANGGSGSMENQIFTDGVEQAISANQFTKDGYTFLGWLVQDGFTENKFNDGEVITISNNNLGKFDVISDRYEFKGNVLAEDYAIEFFALWQVGTTAESYQGEYLLAPGESLTLGDKIITKFVYNSVVYTDIDTVNFEQIDNTFIAHVKDSSGEYVYTISAPDAGDGWYLVDIFHYEGDLIEQVRANKVVISI